MTQNFFEISSPQDMLERAKRDLAKMEIDLSTDTIFNFFVTTYHVMDYVKAQGRASQSAIKQMCADKDFKMCNYICNKGKHIQLRRDDPFETEYQPGAIPGAFEVGVSELGADESYLILDGDQEVNVIDLGQRLIRKWEQFFTDNGI